MTRAAHSTRTAQQDIALDARTIHILDVQARHLVHTALESTPIEEMGIMNRPYLAIQAPQQEIAKRRAASIVDQD